MGESANPGMIATLVDFVVWRAKWRQGIMEEVEIDPVLKEGLPRFVDIAMDGVILEARSRQAACCAGSDRKTEGGLDLGRFLFVAR
jgi:hypothetical protein